MSDIGRYSKIFVRIFLHPRFQALTDAEKVLVFYLLAGPQRNRLGLYRLSIAAAAEDLGTVPETLKKRLANVCAAFGWMFDSRAKQFYVPTWWKWNPPENINVLAGSLKDLHEIPSSSLLEAFATNVKELSEKPDKDGRTVRQTFIEGLHRHLGGRPPTQDQYQESESGKQEQKPALRAEVPSLRSVPSTKDDKDKNGIDEKLLSAARQVLRLTNPNETIDHLTDALRSVHPGDYSKAAAHKAVIAALSERRQAVG